MMINIIYSEFLKLKKSYLSIWVLLAGVFIPGMMMVAGITDYGYDITNKNVCLNTITNINVFQLQFLDTIVFSLVSGYIFSREYTNRTANSLYSYPVSRFKIVSGKFITILGLIMVVYIINFISIFAVSLILFNGSFIGEIMYTQLKMTIVSFGIQIILVPIPALLGCMTKNIIFPTIYGVVGAVISMFMSLNAVYIQLCPFLLPSVPFYYFYRGDPIDYIAVVLSGGGTFILTSVLLIFYLRKCDVN